MTRSIGERLAAGGCVPLLALRLPELERIAWRDGRPAARAVERKTVAAVRQAARRIVRAGDALAHRPGSDCFAVAMFAPARDGRAPEAAQVRAAIARIAGAVATSTGRRLHAGWWALRTREELAALEATLDAALERAAREREHRAVLATVGHELRTPLTSIRGYIETLLDDDLEPATARRFLETARREALRLGRMVEGMFEFSMLDLSIGLREARCDVAERVRATLDATAPLARERAVTIGVRASDAALARVDGDACMHALLNLVENAIKCCARGGRVEVTCDRGGGFARVTVDDDGPGIAADEREAIFTFGVRGANARHAGSGIGLAIVRAIAERAGGDVRVTTSPLGGARFVLRFPED